MSGQGTLVFSHANGFPAGTYRTLFDRWREAGWRVVAVELPVEVRRAVEEPVEVEMVGIIVEV